MTLTAYLSFLSLGCSIQLPQYPSSDSEDAEEEVEHLRRIDQAVSRAQFDVVATISKNSMLIEHKESKENLAAGILTVGTMVSNYVLCFPVVVARHQLQAFPTPYYSFARDTPLYCARRIRHIIQTQGAGVLYAGFGLGILGQAVTAMYESAVSSALSYVRPSLNSTVFYTIRTVLDWGISVPLYPFYRAALILRVQSAGTHRIINNPSDFLRMYRHDLSRFFGHGRIYPSSLPLTSLFTSSCALHIASEKMLMLLYKCIHRVFMHKTQRPSRHHHRRSRRQQLVEQQQQQILESANTFSDISARQNNNNNNNNRPLSPFYGTSGGSGKKEDTSMLRTFYPEIVSGMISSMVTRTLCYPFDSILFKLMLQDTGIQPIQTNYQGFWDCAARTYREEGGLRAFYPGWGGCVLEMIVSYLVLESAWAAYRVIEWKLSKYPYKEPRSVRKARKLQERMDGR